jgi:hypothetical protein
MWAAQICIASAMQYISKNDEVLFVFDKNEGSEKALTTLKKVVFEVGAPDHRVKDIMLMPQKKTVCLDPADFLAFQVREYKTFGDSTKAKLAMPILGDGSTIGYIYDSDQLRKSVDFLIASGVVDGKMPNIPTLPLKIDNLRTRRINLLAKN